MIRSTLRSRKLGPVLGSQLSCMSCGKQDIRRCPRCYMHFCYPCALVPVRCASCQMPLEPLPRWWLIRVLKRFRRGHGEANRPRSSYR